MRWLAFDHVGAVLTIAGVKAAIFAVGILLYPFATGHGLAMPLADLIEVTWNRWDALRFIGVAVNGYVNESIVFYPLYPLAIRAVAALVGDYFWAAFFIANGASLIGLYLFYCLAEREFGRRVALYSLAACLLFPTAYFFNAPYAEGPFLLLTVGAFFSARCRRWFLAGVLGGMAALTRVTGALLFPALVLEFVLQWREGSRDWLRALWLLFIPACFGTYLLLNAVAYGSPFAFMDFIRVHWDKSFAWPWVGLYRAGSVLYEQGLTVWSVFRGMGELAAGSLLALCTVWAFFRLRVSYALYLALVTFLVLSTTNLQSTPRYVVTAFPVFFLMGSLGGHYWLTLSWLILSITLMTLFMTHYMHGSGIGGF